MGFSLPAFWTGASSLVAVEIAAWIKRRKRRRCLGGNEGQLTGEQFAVVREFVEQLGGIENARRWSLLSMI